jgi:hypothetical protein
MSHIRQTLWNSPPRIQTSGSHCAVRRRMPGSRTVLGGKGPLRRGSRRALASCAPFRKTILRDGRLRREPDVAQFLRLAKDANQVVVDKTS